MVMMSSVSLNNDVDRGNEEKHEEVETKRDWGEERQNDVIYKVILKKVIQPPSSTNNNPPSDGLLYATHKVRYIKGAKLPLIVAQLCQSFFLEDEWSERNFHTVFFATYRTFSTASEVLDLIEKEGEKLKSEPTEKKVPAMRSLIKVLRVWLERYFKEDFYQPPHHLLLKRLRTLVEEYKKDEDLSEIFTSSENECDFFTFTKSMVQQAEVKGLQEEACESMNSPSMFSDILDETDDVCVEENSVNMEASRTLLNLLSSQQIAEQLTVKAANLFLRLVPHHCLDAVHSSRDKPATVKATIEQFNKVTYCVQGTCLCPGLKASTRAKVISKWIEVAQECFELKNFSSFHAVISGLQTHPIHRLKQTWQLVSNAHANLLEEMRRINIKDALMKAGLPKGLPEKSLTFRGRKDASVRRQHTMPAGTLQGTVPYLGTFLTDLTYLHTANPDYFEKSLINFNKMRKEFEMLAQLQLWQASCRGYQQFESDQRFSDWFNSVTLPTDDEAIKFSEEIEPASTINLSPTSPAPIKKALLEMVASQIADVSGLPPSSFQPGYQRSLSNEATQINDVCSSETDLVSPRANGHIMPETPSDHEQRLVNVQIIRKMTLDLSNQPTIKEMELCSNDRSPAFMKKAFSLFEFENEDVKNFSLLQFLPDDKELVIPDSGNVFYAMNSSTKEYHFALIELGAELSREKHNKTRTLPLNNKGKKMSRKTPSSSSMSAISPMKRILGMSLTSGFYSPVRELQKQESLQERRDSLKSMTPELSHRKTSADDSTTSSNTISNFSSDESGGESDSPGLRRIRKLIRKGKGHRRNHSDSGHIHSFRTSDAVLSPINMFQPFALSPDGASTPTPHASDSDNDEVTSLCGASGPKGSQSTPILRGQPRETEAGKTNRIKSEPVRNPTKVLRKQESRSKFYVSFQPADVINNQSCSSLESSFSVDIKQSALDHEEALTQPSSASQSLELSFDENEVFRDEIHPPLITVQCPSPQMNSEFPSFLNDQNASDLNDVTTDRRRCASETVTTAL